MDDVRNNPDAVKQAIAGALGIHPSEVDLSKISATPNGVMMDITHPADKPMDANVAKKVSQKLKKEPGFENVNVTRNHFFYCRVCSSRLVGFQNDQNHKQIHN